MLEMEDSRWTELDGGYRTRFDPRPLILGLASGRSPAETWKQLWDELHHQGDVGEASYAAVPWLIHLYRSAGVIDWNTYAIVATIELARSIGLNPDVPKWLTSDYFAAIRDLAEIGATEVLRAEDPDSIRAILSILAIERGLREHAKLLVCYSEDEVAEIASQI
jgi:hypothetical protein